MNREPYQELHDDGGQMMSGSSVGVWRGFLFIRVTTSNAKVGKGVDKQAGRLHSLGVTSQTKLSVFLNIVQ